MKINIHFLIFLCISIIALVCDYLLYFTGVSYGLGLLISSIIIISLIIILCYKKRIEVSYNFSKHDIFFYAIIIFIIITKIWIPDFSYDVDNYHIYLQENIKINKITFDFFAGKNINGFLFSLGDRMHYIFRYLLGYRLGTILSYYAYVIIYHQFKEMLEHFIPSKDKDHIRCVSSLCIFIPYIMFMWIGTYYIDSLIVVFIFEIIKLLIIKNDIFNDKQYIYYLFLLSGIATGIKVTSILLIAPVLLYFFIKNIRAFKWKNIGYYVIGLIIFIIPFFINVYDNYIQTGSPLFPYYNNIFKSKYFGLYSWKDERFGIKNIWYMLIWPVYTSIVKLGYGDNWMVKDYSFAIGYFVLIYCLIKMFIGKKDKELKDLTIITIILNIIWILFLEGYMRYALIIPILELLLLCILLSKVKIINIVLNNFDKFKFNIILSTVLIICGIIINCINEPIISNRKYAFKDRVYPKFVTSAPYGITYDNSAIAVLERNNNPIINLDGTLNTSKTSLKEYDKVLEKYDYFYVFAESKYGRNFGVDKNLKENGFNIEYIKMLTVDELPFINAEDIVYLYKVTK